MPPTGSAAVQVRVLARSSSMATRSQSAKTLTPGPDACTERRPQVTRVPMRFLTGTTTRQTEDRVHRIGQRKKVFVYHLWTENTVEERVHRILEQKQRLYDEVIDVLSNVQGAGLSEDELFGLFGLRRQGRARAGGDRGIEDPGDLLKISPEDFEALVAGWYKRQGYGVRVTQRTRDGGIDLVATTDMSGHSPVVL